MPKSIVSVFLLTHFLFSSDTVSKLVLSLFIFLVRSEICVRNQLAIETYKQYIKYAILVLFITYLSLPQISSNFNVFPMEFLPNFNSYYAILLFVQSPMSSILESFCLLLNSWWRFLGPIKK